MPSHVLVNGLGLTYKSTVGISTATLPDVCKTPSPGGPVPIPYPNFADQGSLKNGTKTVKAKGKMIAVKGSEYSMSFGDEPGTAGGVKSSTFKKETSWITYSFDVKMDGKNVCRHTDKKFHNHKNTVDLAGNVDPVVAAAFEKILCETIKHCEHAVNQHYCDGPPSASQCREQVRAGRRTMSKAAFLGNEKDKCVKKEIERRQQNNDPSIPPNLSMPEPNTGNPVPVPGGGNCYPDIMIGQPPNCDAVYDIKTKCPPSGGAPEWPIYYHGLNQGDLAMLKGRRAPNANYHGKTQADIYADACGVEPQMIHPYSDNCK